MSGLRRRARDLFRGTPSPSPSPAPPDRKPGHGEEVTLVPVSKLRRLASQKPSKRKSGLIFTLGGLLGILVALFFASKQHGLSVDGLIDFRLNSILDAIPAGVVRDAEDITRSERDVVNYDSFAVGLHLQSQGVSAHHPVIMVPGVISTGLESWGTSERSRQYFRKRLWGSWSMMRALVMDKASWKQHIMLDKHTGLDPPDIKLRAAQGFDAADFFITGYWIWNKILENLASIGYDPTNAFTAAYDWRLSYANLEIRDQYFTRLKSYVEVAHQTTGRKVVLVSHSMGGQVLFYFFKWVESAEHGNGGSKWVNTHVSSWINISGCMLGTAKGVPAVLSGEMKDTAQLNAFAVYGLEQFLSKEERTEIFRAMPGISSMLPKGGNAVWGNMTSAPDDIPSASNNASYGRFLSFQQTRKNSSSPAPQNSTIEQALDYLLTSSQGWYINQVRGSYSHGIAHTKAEVEANEKMPRTWLNPLEARLPEAPDLKIFCFYGIGKPTERGYFYKHSSNTAHTNLNMTIDTGYSSDARSSPSNNTSPSPNVDHGVIFGEGDGTVNLLSTGYMCAHGWRNIKRYNPAGAKVVIHEMPHEPDRFSPRGGPNSGDHVDILGRGSLNDLVLRVAGGKGDLVEENIETRIQEISRRVQIWNDE